MRHAIWLAAIMLLGCKTLSTTPAPKGEAKPRPTQTYKADTPEDIRAAQKAYAGDQLPAFEQLAQQSKAVANTYLGKMNKEALTATTEEEQAFDTGMNALAEQSTEQIAAGLAAPGLDPFTPEAEQELLSTDGLGKKIEESGKATGVAQASAAKGGGGASGAQWAARILGGSAIIAGAIGGLVCGIDAVAKYRAGSAQKWKASAGLAGLGAVAVVAGAVLIHQLGLTEDPTALRKARYRQIALLELSRIKVRRDALVADLNRRGLRDAGLNLAACSGGRQTAGLMVKELDAPPAWTKSATATEKQTFTSWWNPEKPWVYGYRQKASTQAYSSEAPSNSVVITNRFMYGEFDLSDIRPPPGVSRNATPELGEDGFLYIGQGQNKHFFDMVELRWQSELTSF